MHKARVFPISFKATFAAILVLIMVLMYWLREFPLSAVDNHFELRCQSKVIDATRLQNLPLFNKC